MLSLTAALTLLMAQPAKPDASAGPRPGKYLVHSYGATNRPPLFLGSVVLEKGGTYKAYLAGDKPAGEGKYEFDAAKKAVIWKSGPYREDGWGGEFTIEEVGKIHKIRLKRTTIATNTVEPK